MLTNNEIKRYNRHIILPEIGRAGQELLKQAKVFVVGAGGLGCPVLQYLAAVGVGKIAIADDDVVDESNLQRQILYTSADVGLPKATQARSRLLALNPFIEVVSITERITAANILMLMADYDIVVDGSDNFATRYLVNDACIMLNKPLVFGSIFKFEGQVSVFNYNDGPTYRCLYPDPPGEDEVPNCSQIGVIGVLPGIVGALQANEVIKIVAGVGEVLSGKLLMVEALRMTFSTILFKPIASNKIISSLGAYNDVACGSRPVREIDYPWLVEELAKGSPYQLIDVRSREEYDKFNIGGELISLPALTANVPNISRVKPVVFICQSGMRSKRAVETLQTNFGFDNLYSLKNGLAGLPAQTGHIIL